MEFKVKKSSSQKINSLKGIATHPYFGIVLMGIVFIMIQFIAMSGMMTANTLNVISRILIYVIVGLGMSILLGYAGLASLGTAGFIGLSTYTFAILYAPKAGLGFGGVSAGIAIVIALLISLILGVAIGFISLRIEGMYLAIITLGVSEILKEVFEKWINVTGGNTPYSVFEIDLFGMIIKQSDVFKSIYYVIVVIMVLLMILMVNIIKSPTGRAMLAMKNSTSAAQAMGISLVKYRLMAFVLATLLAGLGGVLYFIRGGQTAPATWNLSLSLNILAAVVIGGMKSIYGVVIGTFVVFGLNDLFLKNISFFNTYQSAYLIINGALIIIMVMFYPGGVVQLFIDIYKFIKKIISKLRIKVKEYRYGKDESIN